MHQAASYQNYGWVSLLRLFGVSGSVYQDEIAWSALRVRRVLLANEVVLLPKPNLIGNESDSGLTLGNPRGLPRPNELVFDVIGRPNLLIKYSISDLLEDQLYTEIAPFTKPSYDYHEALVCSAFFAACNSGSLRGCSLEELVGRFVSELITPRETNYSALKLDDKVPLKGEFVAHFAFPFDTELPQEVYETLNALQLSRSTNEQSVDAATYKPDGSGTIRYQVLVEVESTASVECVQARIREALARKDSSAKVSFIVVKNFAFKDLEFKQEKLKVRYRSKKGAKGGNSDARVFFVEINGSKKLVLRAIDGKPYEEVSERVIFVISMYCDFLFLFPSFVVFASCNE